jgi:hypothetical protein
MEDIGNKCKGTTRKSKPCNSYPLKGEEYCAKHHPTIKYKQWFKNAIFANITQFALAIGLFFLGQYLGKKSIETVKEDFKRHSLAERMLDSQYNLAKLPDLYLEAINLMNNDPNFKKQFYIDSKGMAIKTGLLTYGKDYKIDFKSKGAADEFDEYINSGRKSIQLNSEDYNYVSIMKGGNVVDSFSNVSFEVGRDFPMLPIINISTEDPTGEYLCTSFIDLQIDSIVGHQMYLSNLHQNNTCKVTLQYDYENDIVSFDQLTGIQFDNKSPFYSIDQEISYYEFLKALYLNARLRIRNAITGDSIKTTDHFIPVNMDLGRTHKSIDDRLLMLREKKKQQSSRSGSESEG